MIKMKRIKCMIRKSLMFFMGFLMVTLFSGCGGGGSSSTVSSNNATTNNAATNNTSDNAKSFIKVLVLYDAPLNQTGSKMGLGYAIMLRNLLGHFDTSVDLLPVDQYTEAKMESYQTTFYLGSYYDNPIPKPFFSDLLKTHKTVVWFKYNLWQMAWDSAYSFNQNFGFKLVSNYGYDSAPSASVPKPGFYDTVQYKNVQMTKYYAFNTTTNIATADPDIGLTNILDASKAQTLVTITDSQTQKQAPYIIKSGQFWYFADLPLSFIGPRDRYLVLCDILHDILGVDHATSHKALVRLEDVNARTVASTLQTLADYLHSINIPFSIGVVPFYRDPLGHYTNGVSREVHLSDATSLKDSLNYALTKGGKIVMHGYTHQYGSIANIQTGASVDDFEFWNAVTNTPVAEDSTAWAGARLDAGLTELTTNGFTPFAWEAPHYQSSPLSIKAVPSRFSKTYQRVVYYTSDTPDLNTAGPNKDFSLGQFFPYVIQSDYYGQMIIPENLGNIAYGNSPYTWQDINENARYALVVRDGVASFFFHPLLLEPQLATTGFADLQSLVQAITAQGYQWADASTLQ